MIGVVRLFVCLCCGNTFEEPKRWAEDRGECFGFPSYEQMSDSPCCEDGYAEAFPCACCGEWITTEKYAKTKDGDRFCENCFTLMELGDED